MSRLTDILHGRTPLITALLRMLEDIPVIDEGQVLSRTSRAAVSRRIQLERLRKEMNELESKYRESEYARNSYPELEDIKTVLRRVNLAAQEVYVLEQQLKSQQKDLSDHTERLVIEKMISTPRELRQNLIPVLEGREEFLYLDSVLEKHQLELESLRRRVLGMKRSFKERARNM